MIVVLSTFSSRAMSSSWLTRFWGSLAETTSFDNTITVYVVLFCIRVYIGFCMIWVF